MLQKLQSVCADDAAETVLVDEVDFSTHAESVWPSVVLLDDPSSRSSTLTPAGAVQTLTTEGVHACRSRCPPATSTSLLGSAQVPTAVVAPIKRELPDQVRHYNCLTPNTRASIMYTQ